MDFGVDTRDVHQDLASLHAFITDDQCRSLLHLLSLGIGDRLESIVPYDLGLALAKIGDISPDLIKSPEFRRLSAVAR